MSFSHLLGASLGHPAPQTNTEKSQSQIIILTAASGILSPATKDPRLLTLGSLPSPCQPSQSQHGSAHEDTAARTVGLPTAELPFPDSHTGPMRSCSVL